MELSAVRTLQELLPEDKSECPICFEDLLPGEKVVYLQCLCIFHENCIQCVSHPHTVQIIWSILSNGPFLQSLVEEAQES